MTSRLRRTAAAGAVLALLGLVMGSGPVARPVGVPVGVPVAAPVVGTVDERASAAPGSGAGSRPLVVVLDVSGSMADTDVDGTIKLAGAISALTSTMRQQRPGAELGLWTYPGRSSCSPGRFDVPVATDNADDMIQALSGLSADGETPTGAALRSVADTLTAEGVTGATVLLISDGESNCEGESPPPCAVAEEIVAEGFDLTVEAAGFQISDVGLDELACIADATGGSLYEADDVDDLTEVLDEAASTQLTLEVIDAPVRVPSGLAGRVSVRVSNQNAREIRDVRVSLSFAVPGEDAIVPAVIPPRVSLGNLAAGESRDYTWSVTFGGQGKTGTARYRVLASSVSGQPVRAEGLVEVADDRVQLADAGPLISDLAGRRVAILGDSFSSGEGAGNYRAGSHGDGDEASDCHQSYDTYLYPLFPEDAVDLLACSGAVSGLNGDDDDHDGNVVVPNQVEDLEELADEPPAAAFLTIGGNDIGFSEIIKKCTFPTDGAWKDALVGVVTQSWISAFASFEARSYCAHNKAFVDEVHERIDQGLVDTLGQTYREVYGALNSPAAVEARGEVAPLVVLAYPQIFAPARFTTGRCPRFDGQEIEFANALVTRLNLALRQAVNRVRADGLRVHLVDTIQEAMLPDHSACPGEVFDEYINTIDHGTVGAGVASKVDKSWFFGGSEQPVQEYLHPNAAGYRAETNVLLSWSVGADTSLPEGHREWHAPEDTGLGRRILDWVDSFTPTLPWTPTVTFDAESATWTGDVEALRAGQPVEIQVVNAAPGSKVYLAVRSRATPWGDVPIEEGGTGSTSLRLPDRLVPGAHDLSAVGFDANGRAVTGSVEVDVAAALPGWVTPALLLLFLTGAAWLASTMVVRRRRASAAPDDAVPLAHPTA